MKMNTCIACGTTLPDECWFGRGPCPDWCLMRKGKEDGDEVEDITQVDLRFATRFEARGKAIMRKDKRGWWVVTDGDGCRTSRHDGMETALREFCRLSEP